MTVGSIVFGPAPSRPNSDVRPRGYAEVAGGGAFGSGAYENAIACNCMGPQPGQTRCPCKLRAEAELGRKMVDEGVTINGKRYRLVPE